MSNTVLDDVDGLSMLLHFDYPEAWQLINNAEFSNGAKFGKECVYFPDAASSVSVANTTGMFNLNPLGNYEFEAFVKLKTNAVILSSGYTFYKGHTYKLFLTENTTDENKSECEALGGHLAIPRDLATFYFLYGYASSFATTRSVNLDGTIQPSNTKEIILHNGETLDVSTLLLLQW